MELRVRGAKPAVIVVDNLMDGAPPQSRSELPARPLTRRALWNTSTHAEQTSRAVTTRTPGTEQLRVRGANAGGYDAAGVRRTSAFAERIRSSPR